MGDEHPSGLSEEQIYSQCFAVPVISALAKQENAGENLCLVQYGASVSQARNFTLNNF